MAAASTLAIGATLETFIAGTTLGIPTLLATIAFYFATSAYQVNSEGDGSVISVKSSPTQLTLIANAMISTARTLKTRGKANDKEIEVHLDNRVAKQNPELMKLIGQLNHGHKTNNDELTKGILNAIMKN